MSQERISKYISYREGVYSKTAKKYGLDNTPNAKQLSAMKNIGKNLFDKLREWCGGPVFVSSFFRGDEVNEKVGGSSTSQHYKGEAIDIDDVYEYKTNAEMFYYIKENLDFDQMIWEFGDDDNPSWVHVSLKLNGKNRKECLRVRRVNGRNVYERI